MPTTLAGEMSSANSHFRPRRTQNPGIGMWILPRRLSLRSFLLSETGYHQILPLLVALNILKPSANDLQSSVLKSKPNPVRPLVFEDFVYDKWNTVDEARYVEETGPFKTWYRWKQIDFAFPSDIERTIAILNEEFIQENVLPLGLETYGDRLFVTFPKWKKGIPYTLTVLPKVPKEESPLLVPYPSWDFYQRGSCDSLTSVFRMQTDICGRLWVLDSGQIDISVKPDQVCPPAIFIFDLHTDTVLLRYELPEEFIKQDSLYSNIIVDVRDGACDDAYAYITDVWRFGLVVFSLSQKDSWRITDHLFFPDPLAAAFEIHGIEFEWTDGIFSLALSPVDPHTNDRTLFFHPMSSFREFYVPTSVIRNSTGWMDAKETFKVLGQSRGKKGHASGAGMDRRGILFYNLISKDAVACWDSRKPYTRENLAIVAQNSTSMFFPNDIRMDKEERTSVWLLTNRLPAYLYRKLDVEEYNFRIISAYIDEAIEGTACDPNVSSFDTYFEEDTCY